MARILVVEDESSIVAALTQFLTREGYDVESASGQTEALERMAAAPADLVLLDVYLSDGNGFAICQAIKDRYGTPVIFLTASGDEYSTVTGFTVGANDYIAKPFRPRELISRIQNILRLTTGDGSVIHLGDVTVDTGKGTVCRNGKDLGLSAMEYRLLMVFLNNRGMVLTRAQLLETVWDIVGDFVNDNTLTVYIKRLREKIEENPQAPQIIKTVRGLGYKVDAP